MTKDEKYRYKSFKKRMKNRLNSAKNEYRISCKEYKRRLKEKVESDIWYSHYLHVV